METSLLLYLGDKGIYRGDIIVEKWKLLFMV